MDFFNKVGSKISSGANAVASGTKKMVDSNRVNGQISQYQSRINNLYTEIGKIYYKKNFENPSEEFKAAFDEIASIQVSIDAAKVELQKIKGTKTCPNCGNEVGNDIVFCNKCGVSLPVPNPAVEPYPVYSQIVCSGCGAQLSPNTSFCSKCGQKYVAPEPVVVVAPVSKVCSNCQAKVEDGVAFCGFCGQKIATDEQPPVVSE